MIRDTGIYEDCGRRIHTTAGYGYEKVEYTRTDTIPNPHDIARAALEKAKAAASATCDAEWEFALGLKVSDAIDAIMENDAELAKIVKGSQK
jgi:hypothetical protein